MHASDDGRGLELLVEVELVGDGGVGIRPHHRPLDGWRSIDEGQSGIKKEQPPYG